MDFFTTSRLVVCLLAADCIFAAPAESRVTKLAEGVYAIEHADRNTGSPSGNTTVIIGERQVLVVDSCYLPSAAREDIAQIRQWTNKPVGYVINTHFHNDHNNGNSTYLAAFPAVAIIAHEETKKDMDLIQPGNIQRMRKQLVATIASFKAGRDQRGRTLTEDEKKEVAEILPGLEQRDQDFRSMSYQTPTLTFADKLDIDLGNREVHVRHLGRGNTPGDIVVYLPKEKVLATGDLLVSPIPYTFDGYPAEWGKTLRNMARLEVGTIIPGHGAVLQGKDYLYLVADLLQSAVDQVRARIRQIGHPGFHTVDEVKDFVDLSPFRSKFAGDDKGLQSEFDQMAGTLVRIVFNEAAQR